MRLRFLNGFVGEEVEVIIVLPQAVPTGRRNVLNLLQEIRSRHPQRTIEEIDQALAAEKDSWDN